MPYDVTTKTVPAQSVASITAHTSFAKIGEAVAEGFGAIVGAIGAAGVQPNGAPFIIFHDVIDEQTDGRIEICVPVESGEDSLSGEVVWKETPGGAAAWTTHRGRYNEVGPAYHTVAGWIQDHGHEIMGAPARGLLERSADRRS